MSFLDSGFGGPLAKPEAQNTEQGPALVDRWKEFLNDPKGRAALVQFGLQLTQPMALGQNALGHVGQALGSAGEAVARGQKQDLAEEEQRSKTRYREQTGEAATARGEAALTGAAARKEVAGVRLGAQADRLALERERLGQQGSLGMLQRTIQAQGAYQRYLKAETDAALLQPNRPPPLGAQEFYQKYGFGDLLGGPTTAVPSGGAAGAASSNTPPAAYPDAKRAPDGNWYVQKDGKYFRVQE